MDLSKHIPDSTTVCIVGGGPAGAVLALLMARKGVGVTLLEAHSDFDRDFRGDSLSPSVMEIMDELGLSERLHRLRHTKVRLLIYQTAEGAYTVTDFGRLKTRHPYMTVLPQVDFLQFITAEAGRYPNFQLIMGANVHEVIRDGKTICGVRYRANNTSHEIRSLLTVGADGRFSRMRRLGEFKSVKISAPMDLLCFRLPSKPSDPEKTELTVYAGRGHYMGMWDRFDHWQINYAIPKGSYEALRSRGIEVLRKAVAEMVPEFSDRVDHLQEWSQVSFLSVESSRVSRWYRPGLLLIGDAAHVMSPAGGVGINCAIQDAVVAANILAEPLKEKKLRIKNLASVQRKREWSIRIIQTLQYLAEKKLISRALDPQKPFKMPFSLRLLFLKDLAARVTGFGLWPVHVKA